MGVQAHGKDIGREGDPGLIAWGITGGEFYLREVVEYLLRAEFEFDIFISRAGFELLSRYGMKETLFGSAGRVFTDRFASAPPIMRLFSGKYRLVVVAPATSNTVAKMVCGISDTLVTNLFAQAGKLRLPAIVLPTDHSEKQVFTTVSGRKIDIYPRRIDLENTRKLAAMEHVSVVKTMDELDAAIKSRLF